MKRRSWSGMQVDLSARTMRHSFFLSPFYFEAACELIPGNPLSLPFTSSHLAQQKSEQKNDKIDYYIGLGAVIFSAAWTLRLSR